MSIASTYIASSGFNYLYDKINRMVIDITIHNSISLTLNNLCSLLIHTKNLDHIIFNNLMTELDIEFKLDLIGGFLSDIKNRVKFINDFTSESVVEKPIDERCENKCTDIILLESDKKSPIKSNLNSISNSLTLGLKYLDKNLQTLHMIITNIKSKIEYHQTKYFNYYRSLDLSLEIEKIKLEYQILISRFDLILKIC